MTAAEPGDRPGGHGRVPARYLALFALLYAIQGVVFAYFGTFNQGYMLAAGVDEPSVNLVQFVVLLPFAFKFLAAPLSDRVNLLGLGHRRPYILIGLALQAVGLVGLSRIDPGSALGAFAAVALLTVVGLALYDTCTDGMVLDITPPGGRERVQSLLISSRFFTATLTTLAFGVALDRTGTGPGRGHGVLWACAALTLIPLAMGAALREPRRIWGERPFDWRALGVLFRPRSLALIAFGTFYSIVAWGVELNLPIFHERSLGYGPGAIGAFGSAKTLGRAVGALLLLPGSYWLGRRGVLWVGVLGLSASEAAQALVGPGQPWMAGGMAFAFGVANGWTETLFYVMAMEASDPRMAASTYALFMAVSNLNIMGSWLFSLAKVNVFGDRFGPTFLASAGLTLLALLLIRPLARPLDRPTDVGTSGA